MLTDIYAAGEAPIGGASLDALADRVRPAVKELHVVKDLAAIPDALARLARSGDLVITLGAGSIGTTGDRILAAITARRERS